MIQIAVDGPDGAGKTPCVHVLADALADAGFLVHLSAPFRQVEVYHLWRKEPMRAAALVRDAIDADVRAAREDGRQVIVYDRHWPTVAVSTYDWRAVETVRSAGVDDLLLLVPDAPTAKRDRGAWMKEGLDRHWLAYRCLAEGLPRPLPDAQGRFDFRRIAAAVVAQLTAAAVAPPSG